jgi:hypothetical protein
MHKRREVYAEILCCQDFRYPCFMETTVTVNSRGVLKLPAKLRRAVGIKADDQLIAEATADGLLLRVMGIRATSPNKP